MSLCQHETIFVDNGQSVCQDCGEMEDYSTFQAEWRYYGSSDNQKSKDPSRCNFKHVKTRGIDSSLQKHKIYDIQEAVKELAEKKYLKIVGDSTPRGQGRDSIVAASLMFAYRDYGNYITADDIRRSFSDIKKKHFDKGLQKYYLHFPEDRVQHISYEKLVKYLMITIKMDIPKHHNEVAAMAREIKKCSKKLVQNPLNRSNPKSVAAAILYLYICKKDLFKKLNINKVSYSNKIKLSENTITKLAKEANKILKFENVDI